MRVLVMVVVVVLAAAGREAGGEQCVRGAVTRFSVRGAYNASGHWEGVVRVERDAQQRGRQGLLVDVEAWPTRCGAHSTDVLLVHAQESAKPSSQIQIIREGYQELPGIGIYKLHRKEVSWDEANETCVAEGTHLLIVDTDEEAAAIQKLINKVAKPTNWFHIGFHDKKKTKNFLTVLGEPLLATGYSRWGPGDPQGDALKEYCGAISKNLELVDISCVNHKVMFICEEYS